MTWNLWWQFGPWQQRQEPILAELAQSKPDILMCQEVWSDGDRDQAEEIAVALGLGVVRTTGADDKPQRFGNAIFSRWPIQLAAQRNLPGPDGQPSFRTVLAVWIDAPGGRQLACTTHLDWSYGGSTIRQAQLDAVVGLIAELDDDRGTPREPSQNPPPLLAGDLNAVPESDEIRRLTGAAEPYRSPMVFTDCWAAVGDGTGETWVRENPHAADALFPRRRLDYVFVAWPRTKPYLNPQGAFLAGTTAHNGMVPSDHYAVVVELDDRSTL